MQKVTILCVGKLKEKFYIDAAAEYVKRLSRFCKLELVELPEERLPEDPSPAQIEAALLKEAGQAATLHVSHDLPPPSGPGDGAGTDLPGVSDQRRHQISQVKDVEL